ncbi:tRNA epoxyqueuosine(34) reductase QueG [Hallella multisaccharivorax]|uniref:tRNA epoxyqueuosine(34) reductase QueG n=1 Tax=Hallella multisaccharivorax TaxID=310514 RepID=UPI003610EDDF
MTTASSLKEIIKAEAADLGFSSIGFARALPVTESMREHYLHWLSVGGHADMRYLENNLDKRFDPRLLMPGVKTIVVVALNYFPSCRLPEGEPQIADYALGNDYHDLVKAKLRLLAERTGFQLLQRDAVAVKEGDPPGYRAFVDSAPVLERYWAVQAGLGWIGKNHQLIIPHAGSEFFLGELFVTEELPPDRPMTSRCGKCHRCVDACPTQALCLPARQVDGYGEITGFSSYRCLSYQTIENRGELSADAQAAMDCTFYGCDCCQRACPWNRFAIPTTEEALQPRRELLEMTRQKWDNLTVETYRRLFKGSAVKRAKYEGLMRNIRALKS